MATVFTLTVDREDFNAHGATYTVTLEIETDVRLRQQSFHPFEVATSTIENWVQEQCLELITEALDA